MAMTAALTMASACSKSADGGGAKTEDNVDENWADVHPPDNVSITACTTIVDDGTMAGIESCGACCTAADYALSSFINQGTCTCALAMPPNAATCSAKTADSQVCNNCCLAAGFGWSDYLGGTAPSCSCDMLTDTTSCKSTVTRTEPADQCALCCLNHGFINATYTATGAPECACS